MLELPWMIAEGAALAVPASVAAMAWRGQRRLRERWRAPICYEHGRPVSLVTLHAELNGETDLEGALRELVGGAGPLGASELAGAVALLQTSPAAWRRLVIDQAVEAVLRGGGAGDLHLMDTLADELDARGFFDFMRGLGAHRPASAPMLLPVDGVLAGGLPELPAAPDGDVSIEAPVAGAGVIGLLEAIGVGGRSGWLPSAASAAANLLRDWQLRKADEELRRALHLLGLSASRALKARTPAGEGLRRNVHRALDAYQTLETRLGAQRANRRGLGRLTPSVEHALLDEYAYSLARARSLVKDKCAALERTLAGREGPVAAGAVLYRHRVALLTGLAADAFPIAPVEAADAEVRRVKALLERR